MNIYLQNKKNHPTDDFLFKKTLTFLKKTFHPLRVAYSTLVGWSHPLTDDKLNFYRQWLKIKNPF